MVSESGRMEGDGDMMLSIFLQTHKSCTLQQPICMNTVEFDVSKSERLKEVIENSDFMMEVARRSFQRFLSEGHLRGSVHIDPDFFLKVCLSHLANGTNQVPNGCCIQDNCSINRFYCIVADTINSMI